MRNTNADIFPSGLPFFFLIFWIKGTPSHSLHLSALQSLTLSKPANQVSNGLFSLWQDVAHFPHRPTARSPVFSIHSVGGRKRGGEGEEAGEWGLVLCLEVTPKASHHIQLDKGIGEISVSPWKSVWTLTLIYMHTHSLNTLCFVLSLFFISMHLDPQICGCPCMPLCGWQNGTTSLPYPHRWLFWGIFYNMKAFVP